ncbi:hypothetical protein L6452_43885 [Arctium lappa]|uniref:Uncharacterized protein n=1 Tax=Arctium lappa TaxID=4217 RepID=A0ACB8XFA5_ARCLA|nr:hypothetical protein L6452_43885 [Arctium lappa]
MEANVCDVNRLDSDVLLPPRKRLLACLKKQNGDVNGNGNSYSPSTCSSLNELDTRINYLLRAHLSTDNPSQEEIVAASRSAAEVAVKVAMAARAAAEEKAVIAAKAMAAAKKALEFIASVDDQEMISSSAEQQLKKNKTKKQVEVQMLYNNKKPRLENDKTNDEELARQLHQAINSSPRISKCGLPSDEKSHKHKKLKISSENGRINKGSIVGDEISPSSNGASKPLERVTTVGKEVENASKSKTENGNAERVLQSKAKSSEEDISILGRKRGRMKQKKLPLSICHDRDQATPKEDRTSRSSLSIGPSANGAMAVERNSSWKCQAFKAPACVKQNKVMQL